MSYRYKSVGCAVQIMIEIAETDDPVRAWPIVLEAWEFHEAQYPLCTIPPTPQPSEPLPPVP